MPSWRNLSTICLNQTLNRNKIIAQDIPEPPTLDVYYWVEYDHDTDMDGIADPDEYQMVTVNSDGLYQQQITQE